MSIIELLRYLSYMAPSLIPSIKAGAFDMPAWQAAQAKAQASDLDALLVTIGQQSDGVAALLGEYSDAGFRGEVDMFGRKASRGSHLVNLVLSAFAAYRMQVFLYLKACGREELNTMNLWGGIDGSM